MKRAVFDIAGVGLLAVLWLSQPSLVAAQTSAPADNSTPVEQNQTDAATQARVTKRMPAAQKFLNRANLLGQQLTDLLGRLKSRIGKLETAGAEVSAAKAKYAEAEKTLTEAVDAFNQTLDSLQQLIVAGQPQALFKDFQSKAETMAQKLRLVRAQVFETIRAVKAIGDPAPASASTSATN